MALSKITVVDDDADLRYLLCELFTALGVATCTPAASLAEIETDPAPVLASELVLLDVNLGAGKPSGVDVHRWLLAQGYAGRIVFLTGHAKSSPLVAEAAATPGTLVLEKPIGIDEIESLLGRSA